MSRYRGPKLRITRRLGNLPGLTQKKSKKLNKPGQHGKILGEGKKKRLNMVYGQKKSKN